MRDARAVFPAAVLLAGVVGAPGAAAGPSESAPSLDLKRPAAPGLRVTELIGGEPLEWAGTRLSGGDINGDGLADLVVSAPGGAEDRPSRRGRLYLVYGAVGPSRPTVDLALRRLRSIVPGTPPVYRSDADVVVLGADDFDHLGASLAVADLDADGLADIVAGAPRGDGPGNSRADCGDVVIIHGDAALPPVLDLSRPPAAVRIRTIHGRAAGDALGSAIAVADVQGDGAADLVLGAPLADAPAGGLRALDAGEVIVVPSAGALARDLDAADRARSAPILVLHGARAGDHAGSAVAAADLDGDGVDDVVVGARGADGLDGRRLDSGEVFVVTGSAALQASAPLARAAAAVLVGADVGDALGGSLAAGDHDGDKLADLAIGAELADGERNARLDAGEVHLLLGRPADLMRVLTPPDAAATARRARGAERGVSPVGEAPAGPEEVGSTGDRGAAAAPLGPIVVDLGRADLPQVLTLQGADPGDHAGARALADLDGDGRAELVVGAEDSSSRRNTRAGGGEVWIVPGGTLRQAGAPPAGGAGGAGGEGSTFPRRFGSALGPHRARVLAGSAGFALYGPVGGAHLGKAAAALDLDGDGLLELVVSAPQAGQSLAGRIWILGGLRPTPPRLASARP